MLSFQGKGQATRPGEGATRHACKLHADDAVFLSGYALWLVVTVVSKATFFGSVVTGKHWIATCWLCMALLVVSEVLSLRRGVRWSWKSAVGLVICVIMAICCFRAGRINTMSAIPFLFCARNHDLRNIFKVSVIAMALTTALVMLAAYQGVINNAVETATDGRLRHYLGFRYPLRPSMVMFAITGMVLYLLGRRLDAHSAGMLLLANVMMYCLTGSRISFALSAAAIVICFIGACVCRRRKRECRKPRNAVVACLLASCFTVAAAFAILTSWRYDSNIAWMADLNRVMGNRLSLSHAVMEKYGVSLFGQKVSMVGNSLSLEGKHSNKPYFYADSLYIQEVIMYGVSFFVAYIGIMTAACYENYRRGGLVAVLLLVLMSVHGVIDNLTLDLWLDPMLFLASGLIAESESIPLPDHR